MTSDYSISLRQLIKGQQHLGTPGHRVTPRHLPKTWFEGLLCLAPISTRHGNGLPSRKWVLGPQLMGWLGQFEGASSVLRIERAKALMLHSCLWLYPSNRQLWWELFFNMEKQSTHCPQEPLWPNNTQNSICNQGKLEITQPTYSEESWAHANSWAEPKLLFLKAIAV